MTIYIYTDAHHCVVGDNWNGIMKDTLREECDPRDECLRNCCVSQLFAPLFFVVFVLMAQFVLVNVVVAVLMKHLEESHKQVGIETRGVYLLYLFYPLYFLLIRLQYIYIYSYGYAYVFKGLILVVYTQY